ncbi:MAG: carbohydrate ABC transporter permease [Christensenellaceae bacterium]|nr:carbohydrate ABC transporter permease [Christensenellaceae bacterium]MEA5064666.1 carbohydrate ABC transporter permease [Eubacteriales bacterium]MEA5068903.1 carbohydrate ABC transporter permease [Christensenellaceae bacterium]
MKNNKVSLSQAALNLIAILLLVVIIFPLLWMVSSSLKSPKELFSAGINLIPRQITLQSYQTVLRDYDFFQWLLNSVATTLGIFALQVFIALMGAFALGYYKTKWNSFMFYFVIITMVIPFQVTMIPNYILVSKMGLVNQWGAVILPYAANATTFFFLFQQVRGIPRAYYEVSHIEGASSGWAFVHVMMGLCKGSIAAVSILTIIDAWNLYFWPLLVLSSPSSRTLTIALKQFADYEVGDNWGPFMATATLASLPVVISYIFFQRHIIDAFISSGIKG